MSANTPRLASVLCVVACVVLGGARNAAATLLLYEGFDYGGTDVLLSAVSGAALGLDGSTYSAEVSSPNYAATGLTFGSLQVSGGKAQLNYYATNARGATRGLNFSLSSGTMYGSFIYHNTDNSLGNTGLLLGSGGFSNNTAELDVVGNTMNEFTSIRTFGSTTATPSGIAYTIPNDPVLVLFEVTNMGTTSGTQTLTTWVLTPGQFANFKSGGLNSSELSLAGTGAGVTNVLQTATYTHSGAGGYISLASTEMLSLFSYRTNYTIDEIRISNAGFDEVTPLIAIPEPGNAALLASGLGLLGLARHRRSLA